MGVPYFEEERQLAEDATVDNPEKAHDTSVDEIDTWDVTGDVLKSSDCRVAVLPFFPT